MRFSRSVWPRAFTRSESCPSSARVSSAPGRPSIACTCRPDSPEPIRAAPPDESADEPQAAPPAADASTPEPPDAAADAADATAAAVHECSPQEKQDAEQKAKRILGKSAACFSGVLSLSDPSKANFQLLTAYASNRICNYDGGDKHAAAAEKALAGKVRSCVGSDGTPVAVRIDGKATREAEAVERAIAPCNLAWNSQVKIVLDAKGRVTRVVSTPPGPQSQCIQKVLSGLSFPCLSSFEVCPEHVIIE